MRTDLPLERVACDLCGADDPEPLLTLHDVLAGTTPLPFQLVRCRRCGLRYLSPRPRAEALPRIYPADYAPFRQAGLAVWVKRRGLRRDLKALWPLLAPPRRVLDLGCAAGDLLQLLRELGNHGVLGIEPSTEAAARARARGLEVVTGTLQDARLPGGSLDAALLSHVIEHLPAPGDTLDELARVLRPGGALVLWLPNADSLAARLLGARWIGYDAPRHLYAFTPRTLGCLLARHGFTVRSVTHEWIGLEWSWALRLWATEHDEFLGRLLAPLHPLTTAALTPVAAAGAALGRAGRMRVVAVKGVE
ncbi:MAG TPA: class I SAM-dependent methyltransferase [Thermomicrobiaceae bacterium]|nr:class I SAM-dependent methyltransferase [Thermomicrobiaceae bacterium]